MDAKDKRAEIRTRPKRPTVQEFKDMEAMYHNTINAQDRLDYLRKFRSKTRMEEDKHCFAQFAAGKRLCDNQREEASRCQLKVICNKTYEDIEKAKALITIEEKLLGGDPGNAAEAKLAEQQSTEGATNIGMMPRERITLWSKEEILDRIQERDDWACGALMVIYKNQTAIEKAGGYTKETNKIGFTKFDAELLTSFAKQYESKKWLSVKQLAVIRRRIPKYWRQLVKAANEGG